MSRSACLIELTIDLKMWFVHLDEDLITFNFTVASPGARESASPVRNSIAVTNASLAIGFNSANESVCQSRKRKKHERKKNKSLHNYLGFELSEPFISEIPIISKPPL